MLIYLLMRLSLTIFKLKASLMAKLIRFVALN
nr:MAG TPA: hypothetical protein [Caudoviricetes sp.]